MVDNLGGYKNKNCINNVKSTKTFLFPFAWFLGGIALDLCAFLLKFLASACGMENSINISITHSG